HPGVCHPRKCARFKCSPSTAKETIMLKKAALSVSVLVVIDGESRLEAARLLGLSSVPCIWVDHLNETEQRLLRLAVNRLAEKGSWDMSQLDAEFKVLILAEAPIELSGFGLDEMDQIVLDQDSEDAEIGELAPDPDARPVSRVGDIFR